MSHEGRFPFELDEAERVSNREVALYRLLSQNYPYVARWSGRRSGKSFAARKIAKLFDPDACLFVCVSGRAKRTFSGQINCKVVHQAERDVKFEGLQIVIMDEQPWFYPYNSSYFLKGVVDHGIKLYAEGTSPSVSAETRVATHDMSVLENWKHNTFTPTKIITHPIET